MSQKQSQMAVFIDFENLALGIQPKTNGRRRKRDEKLDMDMILKRLVEKGKIVVKRAYCDWQRFPEYLNGLHELGIEMIEIPERHIAGKNSADIRLVVDALEMGLTKEHIDTYVVCSGDSDFLPLVSKLRENGKTIIGVGLKDSTSDLLANNCDEFIFYDDIGKGEGIPKIGDDVTRKQRPAFKLLFETIDALLREGTHATLHSSLVKDTIRRKKPQFSESGYGYRSFNQLLEDASNKGYIIIDTDPRSGTYYVKGFATKKA
jgi:uncharacterized protein (TIGR00288 family)